MQSRSDQSHDHRPAVLVAVLIVAACLTNFLYFRTHPLIHDVGWLIEATRRWVGGAQLYVDIIEINPPLIFYEMVALSAGLLSQTALVAGISIIIGLSALWVLRLRGWLPAVAAIVGMVVGGLTDFGQRDHLGLILVTPFLMLNRGSRVERAAVGIWAFFGVGLKPYLLVIPAAKLGCDAFLAKSLRPFVSSEMLSLAGACALYLVAVWLAYPIYLNEIVPLGQFVYWAYGAPTNPILLVLSIALAATAAVPLLSGDRERMPLAAALVAALLSFYVQNRNWTYHFVPAAGLGIILAIWSARQQRATIALTALLVGIQFMRGPPKPKLSPPIPLGVSRVTFLSAHVFSAYPRVLDCSVRNTTRYPALWALPGAWNILHDRSRSNADRQRAAHIVARERKIIRNDILNEKPELLYVDDRTVKPYFQYRFDYLKFVGPLPGYRRVGRWAFYDIWAPKPLSEGGAQCGSLDESSR